MSDPQSKKPDSSSSAGLVLRVQHPGGRIDEFYLANGLTIGRSVANTIVLTDDEAADRTHARVDFLEDGSARLRCVESGSELAIGETAVREMRMSAGVTFRVGQTRFECLSGRRGLEKAGTPRGAVCPYCASRSVPAVGPVPTPCPACSQPVLALDLGAGYPRPFVIPAKFNEFHAQRFVARGGMGIVLQGFAESNQQPAAIKLLLAIRGIGKPAADRFQQEIVMMRRIIHPNVVRLLGFGRAATFSFLAMEWVDGRTLRDVLQDVARQHQVVRFQDALPWFEQVCKGLAAVHAVGIIHRDIKPSNILIAQNGRALLSDLGVAKRIDQTQTALTTTGQLPGTYEYMAPEQLGAPDTVDQRTDLFALGVTFYELLTGERPSGAWLPASHINPTVPPAFDQILSRLLARKPENRYADIHELLAALSVLKQSQIETGSKPAPEPTPVAQATAQVTPAAAKGPAAEPSGLVICPECQREISDKAPACPHCGYPMSLAPDGVPTSTPHADPTQASNPATTDTSSPNSGDILLDPAIGTRLAAAPPTLQTSPDQPGPPDALQSDRNRYNRLSLSLAVPGLCLLGLPILMAWTGDFHTGQLHVAILLGIPLLAAGTWAFFKQRSLKENLGVLPRFFWASLLLSLACFAPFALGLAVAGLRDSLIRKRGVSIGLSIFALLWSTVFTIGFIGMVIALLTDWPDYGASVGAAILFTIFALVLVSYWGKRRAAQKISSDRLTQPSGDATLYPSQSLVCRCGRACAEVKAICLATARHVLFLCKTATGYWRLRGLKKRWDDTRFRLGYEMFSRRLGDQRVIARIVEQTGEIGKSHLGQEYLKKERRRETIRLADLALIQGIALGGLESEWQHALAVQTLVRAQEVEVQALAVSFGPQDSSGHRRIITGYVALIVAIAVLIAFVSRDKQDAKTSGKGAAAADDSSHGGQNGLVSAPAHGAAISDTVEKILKTGTSFAQQGDYNSAISAYTEAIKLDPNSTVAYGLRGWANEMRGELDSAIADCSQAINLDPKNGAAYGVRGGVYNSLLEYDKALADTNEAIRLNPKLAAAYVDRGGAWFGKQDDDKALADLDEAIRLDPKLAVAYANRGRMLAKKSDYDKALADLNEAIRLDPRLGQAYGMRGLLFADKGDNDKALADLNEAVRLTPIAASSRLMRGAAYLEWGETDKAIDDFTEAIRLAPNLAEAYAGRSAAYTKKGDKTKAEEDIGRAKQLGYKEQ